jgi:DNA-binding CsgD family transcriptional regulator
MALKISNELRAFFDKMPGMWGCKNTQSSYQYANAEFARIHGVAHHLDLIGSTAFDLPTDVAAFAEVFHQQEREVMDKNQTLRIFNHQPLAEGSRICIFTKMPWLEASADLAPDIVRHEEEKKIGGSPPACSKEHPNVIGTIFHGIDITDAYSTKLGAQLAKWSGSSQNSYLLEDSPGDLKLTIRESEILFLIIRGKTAKLAAASLGISYRTVQQYIDVLKAKFNVASKVELIDAAMSRGYLNHIPLSLFSKQLSVVLAAE